MPVDAPDGTQAEAVMPLLSERLTMTVGLPRESRISCAFIFSILLMFFSRLLCLLFVFSVLPKQSKQSNRQRREQRQQHVGGISVDASVVHRGQSAGHFMACVSARVE